MNRKDVLIAIANSGLLTPDIALYIRSHSEAEIRTKLLKDNYGKSVLEAAEIPVLNNPSGEIANKKEIDSYLELHCSSVGMDYTGYQQVDKEEAIFAKLDRIWESELNTIDIKEEWFEFGLPYRVARLCGAAMEDPRYKPFINLLQKNIWVFGPDRETFEWYVYDSSGEEVNYPT